MCKKPVLCILVKSYCMRKVLVLSLFALLTATGIAQNNLSGSRRSSQYTYIYQLTHPETVKLFQSNMGKLHATGLHTLVDSFLTDTKPTFNKPGNYLFVQAVENRLQGVLRTIGDVQFKLLNNSRDLVVALHTRQGQLISDANVSINKKNIPFDETTRTFRLQKHRKAGLIKVVKNDVLYLFPLNDLNKPGRQGFLSGLWRRIQQAFRPKPGENYRYRDYFDDRTPYEKKFTGFLVFSKPKYKPGDTVQLKAWVAERSGKPVNRPLLLRLTEPGFIIDSILTVLHPYRPGAYTWQFVVNDSLDLSLDEDYLITLEELSSRKYNVDEYDGDLDEDEYAMQRKVLMRGKFHHEEYELTSTEFTARSDQEEHHRGNPVAVYCKAIDENEMPVMDGRVAILIQPANGGNNTFHAPNVFLPDTLWYHTQPLETVGETKIIIPDSIFPAASIAYEIHCIFLNSNNERKTTTLRQRFEHPRQYIFFEEKQDGLHINIQEAGKPVPANAIVYSMDDKENILQQQSLQLPVVLPINPFAKYYRVQSGTLSDEFRLESSRNKVSCIALRTKDSITVKLVNPSGLLCWYTIFAGNKVIHHGYGDKLLYAARAHTAQNYFVSLQYIYANTVRNEEYTVPWQDKLLTIAVDQPAQVYPGQQAIIGIAVTDAAGEPVPGADVTAYSFTKKFTGVRTPFVPYNGKIYPGRKRYNRFVPGDQRQSSGYTFLDWERWRRSMGLDSIEYFKFLHPSPVYVNTEAAKHGITQIAPFVVVQGALQPVHQVYIDEVPYFFSQAQQMEPYSFKVTSGKHSLRIRTHDRLIKIDNIHAASGMKSVISINADTSNHLIKMEKVRDTLSDYEKNLWSKYMILVQAHARDNLSYIEQSDRLLIVHSPGLYANRGLARLVGPLTGYPARFFEKNRFSQAFDPEGNYLFNVTEGLIKQKQSPFGRYVFQPGLSHVTPSYNLRDQVLTGHEVDSLWQEYLDHRNATEDLFTNASLNSSGNGRLQLGVGQDVEGKTIFIKNSFLFRYDDPDFLRVYKGNTRNFGYLPPGVYRLLLLLKDDQYFIKDSLRIQKDGINYFATGTIVARPRDSVSVHLNTIVDNRETAGRAGFQLRDLDRIKEVFNEKYLDAGSFSRTIYGKVIQKEDGWPVPGATITIKGTRTSVTTDANGSFQINVPARCILVASWIGYQSAETSIGSDGYYTIKLIPAQQFLQDVVVVGYGTQRKMSMTGSVISITDALQGRVAGVMIRGASTFGTNDPPLIIVDGVPHALPGQQTPGDTGPLPGSGNTLRIRFRDDAFWQPSLRTDHTGKTAFTVTFPDDITNWRTFVIAMNDKKGSGLAEGAIRSLKQLSAALSLPQFAIAGDSMNIIGKTLYYGLDSITLKRSFSLNNILQQENTIGFRNARIDTFSVVADNRDSLSLKYTIEQSNGYFDGEQRSIPVFKQGVLETKGFFATLDQDTSFTIQPDPLLGNITLHAETSVLPVLLDEMERIRHYEYFCNEQLASKLKALLLKKKICSYLKKDFREEKNITELISKLNQNKEQNGLWGWWNNNDPALWITRHVTEALLMAQQQGYTVAINKQLVSDYLVYHLETYRGSDKLFCLQLLQTMAAKVDYKKYIDTIEKRMVGKNLYQRLQFLKLKQQLGMPVSLDTLFQKHHRTMFGNIYWGEERYQFFDNAIQNTLLVYQLLKRAGGYEASLKKIRYYFLEQRKNGQWRNTYESSLILETILPDLLTGEAAAASSLVIQKDQPVTVRSFPYTATLTPGEKISVSKQGSMPVYFTAYQQNWNASPQKVAGDFAVQSVFEHQGKPVNKLKAGEPVVMKVTVTVQADADYVMVEIPIPAGCSYKDKTQSWRGLEVHREYNKNKVSIFCNRLVKGRYMFEVSLLPRYTGRYHCNPAKAEMMYFPVFFGREEMKKVVID